MNCPYCKKEIGDTAKFCRYCGREIARCPTCGGVIPYKMRFCTRDGTELPESLIQNRPERLAEPTEQEKPKEPIEEQAEAKEHEKRRAWQTTPIQQKEEKVEKKTVVFWVAVSLLVLILGAGAFWGLKNMRENQSKAAVSSAEGNPVTQDEAEEMDVPAPKETTAPVQEDNQNSEVYAQPEPLVGTSGLGAVPLKTIEQLPQSISCDDMDTANKLQGVEWNTDTMDTFYVCYGTCIVAYDADGHYKTQCNDVGEAQLFSIDYYDGKVLSVMRSSGYSRLKLRVYDADTLELKNSVDLNDIKEQHSSDKKTYHYDDLKPFIGGIMVAPTLDSQKGEKLYICYNSYLDEEDCLGLHDKQLIFEYDFKKTIKAKKNTGAKRILTVDLGSVEYGIQALEYDRTTGNVWCGVHQGLRGCIHKRLSKVCK